MKKEEKNCIFGAKVMAISSLGLQIGGFCPMVDAPCVVLMINNEVAHKPMGCVSGGCASQLEAALQ